MNQTYRNFIILFLIVISILLFFLFKYNNIIEKKQIDILVANKIDIVQNELTYQKSRALSLAILFSKNQKIIDNLKNNNPEQLKKELLSILSNIENYTNENNIQLQVHTKDLKVFVRSWEDKDLGTSLETFRKGLLKVKNEKEPYVSLELGKRYNIKAISPIFDENNEYIGTIEVINDFKDLTKRLKFIGFEVLLLLEKKYLNIASYQKNNQFLYDYVVVQNEFDKKLYDNLLENKKYLTNEKLYYRENNRIITQIPLTNINSTNVGILILSFEKNERDFNYLPQYEYQGKIMNNRTINSPNKPEQIKKEIIIK